MRGRSARSFRHSRGVTSACLLPRSSKSASTMSSSSHRSAARPSARRRPRPTGRGLVDCFAQASSRPRSGSGCRLLILPASVRLSAHPSSATHSKLDRLDRRRDRPCRHARLERLLRSSAAGFRPDSWFPRAPGVLLVRLGIGFGVLDHLSRCRNRTDRPLAWMVIFCSLLVPLSLAPTDTMPLASMSKVTSICGTPRGAGGMCRPA